MASRPSHGDYERALRAGLHGVTLKLREMDDAGGEYDPKAKTVSLDPFNAGMLEGLVHELLHHVLYEKLASFGASEETVTLSLEDDLVRYINRSKVRRRWWRRALKAKLGEGE